MRAAIVTIGSELLDGRIADTNAQWVGGELARRGIEVVMVVTIDDEPGAITDALDVAKERAELVWVTGGLGTTKDDVTVEVLARFLGRNPVEDHPSAERIREWWAQRGKLPTPEQFRQARVPAGAEVFANPVGAAPGFLVREAGTTWVVLPGVPAEMRGIAESGVLPALEKAGAGGRCFTRTIGVVGVPESELDTRIRGVWDSLGEGEKFALQTRGGEVLLRMSVRADASRLDELERAIRDILGDAVYGAFPGQGPGEGGLEGAVIALLRERNAAAAVAESLTGGLVAARLTSVPGASEVFRGGFVTYSDGAKREWLGVPAGILASPGAVSREAALAMARGARERAGADFAVATTGWAGPDGGTEADPVGTVYIGTSRKGGEEAARHWFRGGRDNVRKFAATAALAALRRAILASR